ncbi:MAG: AsmA family protein [Desulfohalobiaceae bacterium]|nr:AsmA family protein [Desulfohalobiaceae bacterium]
MNKPVKISLITLGIIAGLIVLLIAYLLLFFDVNDYKAQIESRVQEQTGRELSINGDMSLSVFPWLGLEVNDLSLSNAKGFEEPLMARFQKALFKVKLLPLLKKDIHIGTLELKQFQIHLAKNEQGVTNWQDLVPEPAKGPGQKQPSEPGAGAMELAGLTIERIRFEQGSLSWLDQTSNTRAQLKDFDFRLGPVQLKSPFPFEISAVVSSNQPRINRAELDCSGKASLDPDRQIVTLEGLQIKTTAEGAAIPGDQAELSLTTDATFDYPNQTLTLAGLEAGIHDLSLRADLKGTSLLEEPEFSGTFDIKEFNPKKLLQELQLPPLETSDPDALTAVAAGGRFSASQKKVAISDLQARLDDTSLQGTSQVSGFETPKIEFSLQADDIDLDRYLPPKAEKKQESGQPEESPTAAVGLPLDTLRALDLTGQLEVGTLTVKKMNLNKVTVQVRAKDGILSIDPLTADLYQGTIQNTTRVDVRSETPKVETKNNLNSIFIEPLLGDLLGRKFVSGEGGIEADLDFQGLTSGDILSSLNGDLSLLFENGSIKGVNIPALIRSASALLKGRQPAEPEDQTTDFTSFQASADLQKGLIRRSSLELLSPLLRIDGQGQVDLLQKLLDYDLTVHIPEDISEKYSELADLSGSSIPLKITGDLDSPSYSLGLEGALKDQLQKRGGELLDKELDKLKEKLDIKKQAPDSGQESEQAVDPKKLLKGFFD